MLFILAFSVARGSRQLLATLGSRFRFCRGTVALIRRHGVAFGHAGRPDMTMHFSAEPCAAKQRAARMYLGPGIRARSFQADASATSVLACLAPALA